MSWCGSSLSEFGTAVTHSSPPLWTQARSSSSLRARRVGRIAAAVQHVHAMQLVADRQVLDGRQKARLVALLRVQYVFHAGHLHDLLSLLVDVGQHHPYLVD